MSQRILIAEDQEDARILFKLILETEGYEVSTATNGQTAYEEFLRQPPDLLITDISMPEMDGLALIRAVKRTPQGTALPVILITAFGEGRLKHLHPLGVERVLEKPIEPQELAQTVREMLA